MQSVIFSSNFKKIIIQLLTLLLYSFLMYVEAKTVETNINIQIGSKRFTESYILSEIIAQNLEINSKISVTRKPGLGNTGILFAALKQGDIDIYPEYLGTISQEILHENRTLSLDEVNLRLRLMGLKVGYPLGFNNSYGLAVRTDIANKLSLKTISDLKKHLDLRIGLSHEFIARNDGWKPLAKTYGLEKFSPQGLDHGLSYKALKQNQVDVIDVYSTDSELSNLQISILEDDLGYFPSYEAVLFFREPILANSDISEALNRLQYKISQTQMQQMIFSLEGESQSVVKIATAFLTEKTLLNTPQSFLDLLFGRDFLSLTLQHLLLVITSLILSVAIGVPFGMLVFCKSSIGQPILQMAGVLQTIPSLALLSFLIFIFSRIGAVPAITALTLYALLPIIENTNTGLSNVSKELKESAVALGANFWRSLLQIELIQAIPAIFSGIKIAAITATGTATIAAFVGAGGYGQRIAEGLAVNNNEVMLSGAVPAAIFAILIQIVITLLERKLKRHFFSS